MEDFVPFFFSFGKWKGALFSPPMNLPAGIVSEMIEFSTGTVEACILFFSTFDAFKNISFSRKREAFRLIV